MIDLLNWPAGLVAAVLCGAAGWFALGLTRDHRDTLRFQRGCFLTAFAIRFAAALVIYAGGLVSILHDEDSSAWIGGVVLMRHWTNGTAGGGLIETLSSLVTTGNLGYQYLLGAFFTVTRLVGRMPAMALTAAIASGGIVFVYRTVRLVATERAARWVAAIITVLPLMIIWSSQTLKEPVVIATESAALYACMRLALGSRAPRHLWLALAAFAFVVPFRFYIAYVLAPGLLLGVWRAGPRSLAGRVAVTAGVVLLLAHVTREVVRRENPGLERVQSFRQSVSPGGSALGLEAKQPPSLATGEEAKALLANAVNAGPPPPAPGAAAPRPSAQPPLTLDVRKPWQLPLVVAIGSTYALLAPFPWQFTGGSLRFLLTAPDMLLWWIIFFAFVVRGTWRAVRHRWREVAPLLAFLLLLGGLYSLMFGNVGIAYRQRAQLVPVLLVLTAAGLAPKQRLDA